MKNAEGTPQDMVNLEQFQSALSRTITTGHNRQRDWGRSI